MASSARGRRRDEGFRAPVLLLIFAIALFAAVVAVSGSPCLHTSSNNASVIKLRHCNLWTLYHWCRGGFGSDEGGEASGQLAVQPWGRRRPKASAGEMDIWNAWDICLSFCLLLSCLAPTARMILPSWSQGAWLALRIWIGRSPKLEDANTLASCISHCLGKFLLLMVMMLPRVLLAPWLLAAVEPWFKAFVIGVCLPALKLTIIGTVVLHVCLPRWNTMQPCRHDDDTGSKLKIAVRQLVPPVLWPLVVRICSTILGYTWIYLVMTLLACLALYCALPPSCHCW